MTMTFTTSPQPTLIRHRVRTQPAQRISERRNPTVSINLLPAAMLGAAIIGSRRNHDVDDDDDVDEVEYERPRRRRGGSWARHVERCYASYRSYNERSDTYVNYDGETRRCRK